ncbi:hypothetical protein ACA910_015737 [Epithemia clementina (nom. ined.)]
MNFERYPWLQALGDDDDTTKDEEEGVVVSLLEELQAARAQYLATGVVTFPQFLTERALQQCMDEARRQEDAAFTTDGVHTAYLKPVDLDRFPAHSIYNYTMPTQVASIAYDELVQVVGTTTTTTRDPPPRHDPQDPQQSQQKSQPQDSQPHQPQQPQKLNSVLAQLYHDPIVLRLVSFVVTGRCRDDDMYLSQDPLGCCSVNVFRPSYHHSFHFDESEFSTTLMLQEANVPNTGLFQYTDPLLRVPPRQPQPQPQPPEDKDDDNDDKNNNNNNDNDEDELALSAVAHVIQKYHCSNHQDHGEGGGDGKNGSSPSCCSPSPLFLECHNNNNNNDDDDDDGNNHDIHHQNSYPKLHTLEFAPGTLLIFSGSRSLHRVTRVEGTQSRLVAVWTFARQPNFVNSPAVQQLFWGRTTSSSSLSLSLSSSV